MAKKRGNDSEDKISQLPDEILVYILSMFTLKEAARTSVLSKRWRDKWTYINSLYFDPSLLFKDSELQQKSLKNERPRYVSWVNQILRSYKGPTIDEFRVQFQLDKSYRYSIDYWIHFAIRKRVQRLDLDLSRDPGGSVLKPYTFPNIQYTPKCLRSRSLGSSTCNSLTTLRFRFFNVCGEVLECFLSNCLFLERLHVEGSNSLVNLKVAGPSLRLKYLEIYYCLHVKNLEIFAKNLVSFKYFGPKISLPLKDTPQLVEILIGGNYCEFVLSNYRHLSSYIFQIETLVLDLPRFKESMTSLEFPVLNNLKYLEWRVWARDDESLLIFTSLIEASPFLNKFVLQLDWIEPILKREKEMPKKCSHECLKVVELVGFVGRTIDVELAMYFIENAVMLEKIVFDPRSPSLIGSPWEYEETKEIRAARKHAKRLGKKMRAGVDFIIL